MGKFWRLGAVIAAVALPILLTAQIQGPTGGGGSGGASNITQVGGVNVPTGGGLQSGALPVDESTSSQFHADFTAPQPYLPATTPTTNTYLSGTVSPVNGDLHGGWYADISAWAAVQLGAPSNYGTSPGAVTVPGVNAFVTNTIGIAANSSVNVAQFGGVSTATGQVAVSVAPVTATNTALVVDLRPDSPGIITLGQTTKSASVPVTIASDQYVDPCQSPNIAKSSAPINITTATTTSLVAVSGSTTVYVCGISFTIAPSATTADSLQFEYGTGAACTSPTVLTGTFGSGDLTTTAPLVTVNYGGAATIFKSAASAGICAVSLGNVINIQGVLTFVQQ